MLINIPTRARRQYEEVFSLIDKDLDGSITNIEFKQVLAEIINTMDDAEFEAYYETLGVPSTLNLHQFTSLISQPLKVELPKKEHVLAAFQALDLEDLGTLNVADLEQILKNIPNRFNPNEMNLILKKSASPDKPELIEYEKFVDHMYRVIEDNRPLQEHNK